MIVSYYQTNATIAQLVDINKGVDIKVLFLSITMFLIGYHS